MPAAPFEPADPDPLAHLDFPTELPIDPVLIGVRATELILSAPPDVIARIAPHFRPGNTSVRFIDGEDAIAIYVGPEPVGTIAYAALIRPDDTGGG